MATLKSSLDTDYPCTIARATDGAVYVCTGNDTPQRWNFEDSSSENAGITSPSAACAAATSGSGALYGDYTIYVRYLDDDDIPSNFSASASLAVTAGSACSTINYTSVPVAASSRVTQREVWRNTDGQSLTFYKDATIADNTGATTSSTKTDSQLQSEQAIRILSADGRVNANRFTPPPSHMRVVTAHQDRLWFCAPPDDYSGDDAERNTVYFSEAGEPESVPAANAKLMQADGDVIVGMTTHGPNLLVLKERHVYKVVTAGDPYLDLSFQMVATRGVVNQRCFCHVEGQLFLLDRGGAYVIGPDGGVTPISGSIQDYWRGKIHWENAVWFSVAHAPEEEIVRFFVCLDGSDYPRHALVYHYRLNQWWEEEYPWEIGAAETVKTAECYRMLAGAGGRVMLMDEGVLDGPAPSPTQRSESITWGTGTVSGTVTSSGPMSITDTDADFSFDSWFSDPGVEGSLLTIVASDGTTNTWTIQEVESATYTIRTEEVMVPQPSVGDTYHIGAIQWSMKLGAWNVIDVEQHNPRRFTMRFEPLDRDISANLKKYYNLSGSPETHEVDEDRGDGISREAASENAVLDLTHSTGYLRDEFAGHLQGDDPAHRMVEFQLDGVSGQDKIQIYEIEIDGVQ